MYAKLNRCDPEFKKILILFLDRDSTYIITKCLVSSGATLNS